MKLELKNIKVNHSLSEETFNYSATLYADGKAVAKVGNRGTGGADEFEPLADLSLARLNEIVEPDADPDSLDRIMALECWCAQAVADHEDAKDLRRNMKRKVLFVTPDGGLRSMSAKGVKTLTASMLEKATASIRAKYGDAAVILNGLADAELLAAARKATH